MQSSLPLFLGLAAAGGGLYYAKEQVRPSAICLLISMAGKMAGLAYGCSWPSSSCSLEACSTAGCRPSFKIAAVIRLAAAQLLQQLMHPTAAPLLHIPR